MRNRGCCIVIASEAKQFILPLRGTMDCFASLAMTGLIFFAGARNDSVRGSLKIE
jgi:hypothetical protein